MDSVETLEWKLAITKWFMILDCIVSLCVVFWVWHDLGPGAFVTHGCILTLLVICLVFHLAVCTYYSYLATKLNEKLHPRPPLPPGSREVCGVSENVIIAGTVFVGTCAVELSLMLDIWYTQRIVLEQLFVAIVTPLGGWFMYRGFVSCIAMADAQEISDWELNQQVKND